MTSKFQTRKLETRLVQVVPGGKWHAISEFHDECELNIYIHAGIIKPGSFRAPMGTIMKESLCKICFPSHF